MNTIKNNDNVQKNDQNGKENELVYEYDLRYILSTKEGLLAKYLAEGLRDTKNIRYYISVTLDHSEKFLKEIYRKAKETPEHRIKKSRGALFAFLIKRYGEFDTFDD